MLKEMTLDEIIKINGGDITSPNWALLITTATSVIGLTSKTAGIASASIGIIYAGYCRLKDEKRHPEKYKYIKYQHNNYGHPVGAFR